MKVLVLLSLVAFSAALPTLLGRTALVKEDGTVTLTDSRGHQLVLLKSVTDPRQVEVILRSPNTRTQMFQVGEPLRTRETIDRTLVGVSAYQNYNQADILTDIFRQYEGTLDDTKYYSLLNRIQMLVEAGLINETIYDIIRDWDLEHRVQGISDIVPTQGVNTLRQYVGQVGDVMPLGENVQSGIYRNWNLDQDLLQNYSPLRHFQTLLGQIQQQRQLQQGLLSQQQYLPQQYLSGEYRLEDQMNTNQILNQIYRQQLGQSPLNRYLVNMRLVNGQQVYEVPEEFVNIQLLEQLTAQQEMINQRWAQMMERRQPITEDVHSQQHLINQQIEKLIEQLAYHQNLITREVEQYIVKGQVVPQQLVYQQRLVYQQVHEVIERLYYQQLFMTRLAENITEVGTISLQRWILQHNIINEQIQQLIQQVLYQQTHVRQQIQVLIQQGEVIPQELVLYQRITYQNVERVLQVLIKQFVYQQTYFKQLIQLLGQQRYAVPQELVSQYFTIYSQLLQLVQHGDVVPQELVYQQRLIHQQIVLMLQQLKVVPQQVMAQRVPTTQQERLWQTQNLYQTLPRVY
uniref:Encapsulation-relating protein n=1 Tax=Diabrotica virgifera virgifera TaxID=50390 RepID=D7EYY4_DIAVI|nr:encapsulation-relating protein [Diabrotica virgifera virgifera]